MGEATLGGTADGTRNIINGDNGDGVFAVHGGNVIQGNYIGSDITGMIAMGNNGGGGMYVYDGQNDLIGGTSPGARNVVASNGYREIFVSATTGPVVIEGNYIGVDKTGNVPMGNLSTGFGIDVEYSSNVQIGGTTSDTGNVIGGRYVGIGIGSSSSNITIQGNSIGMGADGHTPVSNVSGIGIAGGSTNNLIGGTTSGAGNIIALNNSVGISLSQYSLAAITTGNAILGNSIHDNNNLGSSDAGLGIDIIRPNGQGLDGPNTNDPGDGDSGNNDLQNYPVVTNVINGSGSTTIQGALNSTPNSTFRVEFFSNSTVDPSGYGEGEHYFGFTTVTTDSTGNASFSITLTTPSTAGMYISATATNSGNNTSEFSLAFQAPLNSPPTANVGGPYIVGEGTNLQLNGSGSSDPDGNLQTYEWDLDYNGIAFDVNASGVQPNVSFNDNFAPRMIALEANTLSGTSGTDLFFQGAYDILSDATSSKRKVRV